MDKNSPIDAEEFSNDFIDIAKENHRDDLALIGKIIAALYYQKNIKNETAEQIFSELGIPEENKWLVSGPYINRNTFSYDHIYPPEMTNTLKPDWQFSKDGLNDGYIDFKQSFSKTDWAVAYAKTFIDSPEELPVEIRIGSDEAFKLWLNDNLVLSRYLDSDIPFDEARVKVILHPGYNKLMIKVVNRIHEWGFFCRVTDADGNGLKNVKFYHPQEISQTYAIQ